MSKPYEIVIRRENGSIILCELIGPPLEWSAVQIAEKLAVRHGIKHYRTETTAETTVVIIPDNEVVYW